MDNLLKRNGISKYHTVIGGLVIFVVGCAAHLFAQSDNGIPVSKANDFAEKYSAKTSSDWRTYHSDTNKGDISFNPKTSEISFNPVTKRYEAVIREQSTGGDQQPAGATADSPASVSKTEQQFNPVTKKFESVCVEAVQTANGPKEIQYPQSLDNGLPAKTANEWKEEYGDNASSESKTYKNMNTGQEVSFNPKAAELWYNPAKGSWEPVVRDKNKQRAYLQKVAEQLADQELEKAREDSRKEDMTVHHWIYH